MRKRLKKERWPKERNRGIGGNVGSEIKLKKRCLGLVTWSLLSDNDSFFLKRSWAMQEQVEIYAWHIQQNLENYATQCVRGGVVGRNGDTWNPCGFCCYRHIGLYFRFSCILSSLSIVWLFTCDLSPNTPRVRVSRFGYFRVCHSFSKSSFSTRFLRFPLLPHLHNH